MQYVSIVHCEKIIKFCYIDVKSNYKEKFKRLTANFNKQIHNYMWPISLVC